LKHLVIDTGNTRTKAAIFDDERLVSKLIWDQCTASEIIRVAEADQIERILISEVGQSMDAEAKARVAARFPLLELTSQLRFPFEIGYLTPATLGKDRLAAVAGAFARFPQQNCLIIDAGTCITYELLSAAGKYLGGNISPGLRLRFRALPVFTAGLPLLEPGETDTMFGISTETAIRNGIQEGLVWEVEGAIAAVKRQWNQINILLTGGDAHFFEKKLKNRIFVYPDLVLEGLNKILNYNV
jgi:type III pantothenate kinase